MTVGALIFAFNNESTDYVKMASWNANNIRRHLRIPVAVVTDCADHKLLDNFDHVIPASATAGGQRWFEDYGTTVTWYNAARVDAYANSPWSRTLVLDADYVVASSALTAVTNSTSSFMCHKMAIDVTTGQDLMGLNSFGRYQMPMWWATVMWFDRSNTAEFIFDSMHMVRSNWQHYRDLYGIDRSTYRNDFALSIAVGIVSGHTGQCDTIPWPLVTALPNTGLKKIDTDCWLFRFRDQNNQIKEVSLTGMDFHAMGKRDLANAIETYDN